MSFDNKPNGTGSSESSGSNNWSDSRLMMLLNPGYEDNELMGIYAGSIYWNSGTGLCAGNQNGVGQTIYDGQTANCNYTSDGLKNDGPTKDMIETVKWKLGGISNSTNQSITASDAYIYERGIETCQTTGNCIKDHATEWVGKIALPYLSDAGYATKGGNQYDRQACLDYKLYGWNSGDYKTDCVNSNWFLSDSDRVWYLTPISTDSTKNLQRGTYVGHSFNVTSASYVKPTLYLKSTTKIIINEGDGSISNPYIIVP